MYMLFYKHMKIRNQTRLCLAIYNFEPRIMLSLCKLALIAVISLNSKRLGLTAYT